MRVISSWPWSFGQILSYRSISNYQTDFADRQAPDSVAICFCPENGGFQDGNNASVCGLKFESAAVGSQISHFLKGGSVPQRCCAFAPSDDTSASMPLSFLINAGRDFAGTWF